MSNASPHHILRTFDETLASLHADVLMMAGLVQRSLERALHGLFGRDDVVCNQVIADDAEIDALEKQIDARGIQILTLFHPVASDLRDVVVAMKISSNLERVADQATNIARRAKKLTQNPELPEQALLRPLSQGAVAIFDQSIAAYRAGDVTLASTLKAKDRELDAEHRSIGDKLIKSMERGGAETTDLLNLVLIARHLERVGDHGTNIAEEVVFAEAAEDIRHSEAS